MKIKKQKETNNKAVFLFILSIIFIILLAVINLASAETECTIPKSGMHISANTVICPGYYETDSIAVDSAVLLDCSGAIFEGKLNRNGLIINSNNARIKNCNFLNYKKGIVLNEAENVFFEKVLLKDNVIGLYSLGIETRPVGITFEGNEQDVYNDRRNEENEAAGTAGTDTPAVSSAISVYEITNHVNQKIIQELKINPAKIINSKLEITKKVEVSEKGTVFTISITPKKGTENLPKNLLIYEHIPKEIAESAEEVEFIWNENNKNKIIVINNDPDFLIPIGRIKITSRAEIKYRVAKKITKEEAEKEEMPSTIAVEGDNKDEQETEEDKENTENTESRQEEQIQTAGKLAKALSMLKPKTKLPIIFLFLALILITITVVYHFEKRR